VAVSTSPRPELFFELSHDLLCIAGMDGYFKQVNAAWERTLGYTAAELCARPYLDFVHPADRAATQAVAANLTGGHEVLAFENRLRRSDGSYCWLLWSSNARLDEQLIYAVARDITESKLAELAGQRWAAHLEILRGIDRGILSAQPAAAIAATALSALRLLLGCRRASAALFDLPANQAEVLAVETDGPTQLPAGARVPLEAFGSLPALLAGEAFQQLDIAAMPDPSATDRQLLAEGIAARLNVPLRIETDLVGTLNLGAAEPGPFAPELIEIAQSVADQLAVAVRHGQLRDTTRQRLEELTGLHEIASSLSFVIDVQQTYGRLAERVARLVGADYGVIVLRDADGVWRAQSPGYGLGEAAVADLYWRADPDMRPVALFDSTPQPLALAELPARLQALASGLGIERVMFAPMWIGDRLIGHLIVSERPEGFGEAEVRLLGVIAGQAAVVIHNTRLFAQLEEQARQTTALLGSAKAISSPLDFEAALNVIADQARELLDGSGCRIHLLEPDGDTLRCVIAQDPYAETLMALRIKVGQGLVGRVAQSRQPLTTTAPHPDAYRLPGVPPGLEGCLALTPMVVQRDPAGDRLLGVMTVWRLGLDRPFRAEEERLLAAFATHAALAIERAQLYESEREARAQAEVLRAAATAITETFDLELILDRLLDYVGRLVPYDSASVLLVENGGRAVVRAGRGYERWSDAPLTPGEAYLVSDYPVLHSVVALGQVQLISDVTLEPAWVPRVDTSHVRCWVGVPLRAGERVIGVYSLDKTEPGYFTREHIRLAEALAAGAVIAIQNARLFEQVRTGRAQLQALSHRLVDAQESERRALARELHDEVGQALTGLKLLLSAVRGQPPEASAPRLTEALDLVSGLMGRVHDLSLDLRPAMLDDLGLPAALAWLFERYTSQTGVRVTYTFRRLDDRLPPEVETTTYRIVQEALTNVARHAVVDSVRVRLMVEAEALRLQVQDEGRGFDVSAALASGARAGLAGMRERAALLGGALQIDSLPGAGTLVLAVLPLAGAGNPNGLDPAG
jgi:PAS domain S-box-containing protein